MTHRTVYSGLRNLPPNVLPSDPLDRARFFNSLHDASTPGPSTLTAPGFEAYLARKAKEPPPVPHGKRNVTTSSSLQSSRNSAFLAMYGIDESDLVCNVKKDPYITSEQARVLSFKYNPDRVTKVLPAGDLDAVAYNFLTPDSIKQEVPVSQLEAFEFVCDDFSTLHQYATVLDVNESLLSASEVTISQSNTAEPSTASQDSGYDSPDDIVDYRRKTSRHKVVGRSVQLKVWYTERPSRNAILRVGVKLRRVRHFGVGSHSLVGSRIIRSDVKYGGRRLFPRN